MKPHIFKDSSVQAKFDEDGYVVIDFIDEAEINLIGEKFYELYQEIPKGFYSASLNPDDGLKDEIYTHTHSIFAKVVEERFKDYKILGSTFLCKSPGDEGKVNVHQDWTVVDESKYYSLTIWVPVVDTDEKNGALMVLPGSHLFFDNYRSNHIELSYRGKEDLLWNSMITVPMKAGQAIIINHAIIHASAPNQSEKERLVVAYAMVHKDADLIFYYKDKEEVGDRVEKFEMPDDFFQKYYNIGKRPLFGQQVEEFNYSVPAIGAEELRKLINKEREKRDIPPIKDIQHHSANSSAWHKFTRALGKVFQ